MKLKFAVAVAILGIVAFGLTFVITQQQTNVFVGGLAPNLIAIAIGIVIVNMYCEYVYGEQL